MTEDTNTAVATTVATPITATPPQPSPVTSGFGTIAPPDSPGSEKFAEMLQSKRESQAAEINTEKPASPPVSSPEEKQPADTTTPEDMTDDELVAALTGTQAAQENTPASAPLTREDIAAIIAEQLKAHQTQAAPAPVKPETESDLAFTVDDWNEMLEPDEKGSMPGLSKFAQKVSQIAEKKGFDRAEAAFKERETELVNQMRMASIEAAHYAVNADLYKKYAKGMPAAVRHLCEDNVKKNVQQPYWDILEQARTNISPGGIWHAQKGKLDASMANGRRVDARPGATATPNLNGTARDAQGRFIHESSDADTPMWMEAAKRGLVKDPGNRGALL